MRRLLAAVLVLAPALASAQAVSNRGMFVRDEGSNLGFARTLDMVGSTVSCGISGGVATCTFSAPSVTITHNSTATSGCTAGGLFRSTSNLADCGPGLTYASNGLNIGGTSSSIYAQLLIEKTHTLAIGFNSAASSNMVGSYSNGTLSTAVPLLIQTSGLNVPAGATVIGSWQIIGTTVPLTVSRGSSSGNIANFQTTAGNTVSSVNNLGYFHAPDGTVGAPSFALVSSPTSGFWSPGSGTIAYSRSGAAKFAFATDSPSFADSFRLTSTVAFSWSSGDTSANVADLFLSREAAAIMQMGADVNGAAVNQTFKAHDGITGTNISGANLTIAAGRGTGSGAGGTLAFQTAPIEASGTTAQTLVDRLTIPKTGGIQLVTASTKPTCDSAARGQLFYVAGGAGVADTYEVCVKSAGDTYSWTAIF